MRIGIFAGSFKPPHKGHYDFLMKSIKKDKLEKVILVISKYPRYLEDIIQNPRDYKAGDLSRRLKVNEGETKEYYLQYLKEDKIKHPSKYPFVDAKQSKAIWEIYLQQIEIPFEIHISHFFSPILHVNSYLAKSQKKIDKNDKKNQYFLYKSSKNAANQRFDFLQKKYPQIRTRVIPLTFDLHARDFRERILSGRAISSYLPAKMAKKDVAKIKEILGDH